MPLKNHPFYQAPVGAVFAVAIVPGRWGFVRFFRGRALAVFAIVATTPNFPNVDLRSAPVAGIFFSFAANTDPTDVVALGTALFDDETLEWAPPCFYPPDAIENCYKIHEQGMVRKTVDENDVRGMRQCRRVRPTQVAEFLRERLERGELF